MKKIVLSVFLFLCSSSIYAQLNISLASNLSYNGLPLSNIGGYVDSLGNEYALVGYYNGLSIVNVTNPAAPFIAFDVPGTPSEWREVKTWGKHAYVTTEGCCLGLQIIDLSNLPASINSKYWRGDGAIANQLNTIHALHIDNGYVYLYGSNISNGTSTGAALIVSLADPWNPTYMSTTPGTYIHDGYVRNDTLYSCHIYDGYFSIFDVTNKLNPVSLATQITPGQFTHNSWLNTQGNVLFTTDEVTNSYLTSYDISNINNIKELDRFQYTPGSGSIVHNVQSINDFEVVSWYKDGVAIVDASRPDNMILVGYYDTYPQGSGDGFNGDWGVYPYLPSGNLVVSDIDNGLFVLTPTYIRGCYLEGNVTDSLTGAPINNATVSFIGQTPVKQTKITGDYKTGLATAGIYDVQFSKPGYITKIISGVSLTNGVVDTLNVQLSEFNFTGSVLDSITGTGIPNAIIIATNGIISSTVYSDNSGNFVFNNLTSGTYDLTVTKWGYVSQCTSFLIDGVTPAIFHLQKGYYDDFSTDNGWTVQTTASTGAWVRAIPVGTNYAGGFANANVDVTGDCGSIAWVTGNGTSTNPNADDVDDGYTKLVSPVFDGTLLPNSAVSYYRWFFMPATVAPASADTMFIYLSNGIDTATFDYVTTGLQSHGGWFNYTDKISNHLIPTSTMKLIVYISDKVGTGNILEGGFDQFQVIDGTLLGVQQKENYTGFNLFPNPFTNQLKLQFDNSVNLSGLLYIISDLSGRELFSGRINSYETEIPYLSALAEGTYLFTITGGNQSYLPKKIIKIK